MAVDGRETTGPSLDNSIDVLAGALNDGLHLHDGPSGVGPAAQCRHGGPDPRKGKTLGFLSAMMGSLQTCMDAFDRIRDQSDSTTGQKKTEMSLAELDIFCAYWSRPEMAKLISRDSYLIAFSCAVDAAIDENYAMARLFVRSGIFARQWTKQGGAAFVADLKSGKGGFDAGAKERLADVISTTNATCTDRGVTLYLAEHVPCGCLASLASMGRDEQKTRKCWNCDVQKASKEIQKCSKCRKAVYCSRHCQMADWDNHKQMCNTAAKKGDH